jgi:hypothetical protein
VTEAIRLMMLDPSTAEICPECGTRIAERERIGRSLYLRPCGHRVGQIDEEGRLVTCTVSLTHVVPAAVADDQPTAVRRSDAETLRARPRFERYIAFGTDANYPAGGLEDISGSADTIDESVAIAEARDSDAWYIVDRDTWLVVRRDVEAGPCP